MARSTTTGASNAFTLADATDQSTHVRRRTTLRVASASPCSIQATASAPWSSSTVAGSEARSARSGFATSARPRGTHGVRGMNPDGALARRVHPPRLRKGSGGCGTRDRHERAGAIDRTPGVGSPAGIGETDPDLRAILQGPTALLGRRHARSAAGRHGSPHPRQLTAPTACGRSKLAPASRLMATRTTRSLDDALDPGDRDGSPPGAERRGVNCRLARHSDGLPGPERQQQRRWVWCRGARPLSAGDGGRGAQGDGGGLEAPAARHVDRGGRSSLEDVRHQRQWFAAPEQANVRGEGLKRSRLLVRQHQAQRSAAEIGHCAEGARQGLEQSPGRRVRHELHVLRGRRSSRPAWRAPPRDRAPRVRPPGRCPSPAVPSTRAPARSPAPVRGDSFRDVGHPRDEPVVEDLHVLARSSAAPRRCTAARASSCRRSARCSRRRSARRASPACRPPRTCRCRCRWTRSACPAARRSVEAAVAT